MYNFEDELTCPICYSIFEDPRVLPCSHTFCRNCLENVLQASGNFYIWRPLRIPLKCPNCRSSIEIAPTGIESLPVNFALRAIIEKYQQEDHPHIVTCPEHYRQPLNVYCLLDKKLVCGQCLTIGQHHGHPIDDLQSAYLKEKDTPQKLLEQLTDTHWTDLTCLIEKLEEQKSHSEKMVQSEKEVVLQYFKELSDTLEQKKKIFLTALCEVGNLINQEYTPHIERIKEMREQQLELMTLTTSLREDSPLKFLEKVDDVRQRVQVLKQRPLPEVQCIEIYPRVSQVLKEDWNRTEIGQIKKLLIPEMNISSKRMPCSWPDDAKEVEFFKILNIVIITLISMILMTILFFNQHIITFLNEITSLCFSEASLCVYQSLCNGLHDLQNILCHTLYLLKEFMWNTAFH
ncbi:tripartite motif-containing protein 59 [Desmodus rotundus]|uniref:Tripartite motif-containing protein 59 n=1 Tax=Desmodus rotundus TaxID=9430 RepID=K9IK94_DESRO|nr:tripartite motif-containing protein 59 [Desmodus rotundus]XP_053774034.1 tripartite motif-containing protein 59 [Desmodus rotundus]XP_053774035.1 tripartite motif-containing protein 59 [Desmodus rotundus]XP_053774036.1 tripartite motif-containing protein 59 [Desmodus rotundus]XP_053774037.1 tripartite motif-containing protein 59 [Desmodus rotundus]